jgi:hypothetical protein
MDARPLNYVQQLAHDWAKRCFGAAVVENSQERAARVLEEAIELYQSEGGTLSHVYKTGDYVFGRPVGEPRQEAAGVGMTLLIYAASKPFSLFDAILDELHRVLAKPVEYFAARHRVKQSAGIAA